MTCLNSAQYDDICVHPVYFYKYIVYEEALVRSIPRFRLLIYILNVIFVCLLNLNNQIIVSNRSGLIDRFLYILPVNLEKRCLKSLHFPKKDRQQNLSYVFLKLFYSICIKLRSTSQDFEYLPDFPSNQSWRKRISFSSYLFLTIEINKTTTRFRKTRYKCICAIRSST